MGTCTAVVLDCVGIAVAVVLCTLWREYPHELWLYMHLMVFRGLAHIEVPLSQLTEKANPAWAGHSPYWIHSVQLGEQEPRGQRVSGYAGWGSSYSPKCLYQPLPTPSFPSREPCGAHGVRGGTLFRAVSLGRNQYQSWGSTAGPFESVRAVLHWEPGLRPAESLCHPCRLWVGRCSRFQRQLNPRPWVSIRVHQARPWPRDSPQPPVLPYTHLACAKRFRTSPIVSLGCIISRKA